MGFQIYRKSRSIFGDVEEVRGEFPSADEAEKHLTAELKAEGFTIRHV